MGYCVGLHKHTAVQLCHQLEGPGALRLFGRISSEEVITERTEPGLKGPDSSTMKLSLFLTLGVGVVRGGGEGTGVVVEKDAVEAILTLASGTLLISMEATQESES